MSGKILTVIDVIFLIILMSGDPVFFDIWREEQKIRNPVNLPSSG
jgi:hypothetical protein